MNEEIMKETCSFDQTYGNHVFYCTDELERYIDNTVAFVVEGIKKDEHIILVENARIYPMIQKKLCQRFEEGQLAKVHHYNNFDFYWKNKNFHGPTVLAHFEQVTGAYLNEGKSIRTWGHVEWGRQDSIEADLENFEKEVELWIPDKKVISVCAYDSLRLSETLKQKLMGCHGFLMTDNDLRPIYKA